MDQPQEQKPESENSVTNVSGGVNANAERIDIGGDAVGRDKITSVHGHVIHAEQGATVIVGAPEPPSVNEDSPAPGVSPFKGLQYFDVTDAELFFGREQLTAHLVARLRHESLLAVVGSSGSGKSSVLRAGLIDAIQHPSSDALWPPLDSADWPVHILTPTAHPLMSLAVSLTRDASSEETIALMDAFRHDARSLRVKILKRLSQSSAKRLVLIVDQFEELFTQCADEDEREQFIDNLLMAVDEEDGLTLVVIGLRADYYEHCARFTGLREALARHQEYIGPMSQADLERAIEEPAVQNGWRFEPGLVALMLQDISTEPGALPLLSHALLRTWENRRGVTMTLDGYTRTGGVRDAIAKSAEDIFNELRDEQQAAARNIFLRLTDLGENALGTRRRANIDDLMSSSTERATAEFVFKILVDARLVTTEQDTAEVAHEALIRGWPRLRNWLEEDREGLRIHQDLGVAAQAWSGHLQRDPSGLYRGLRLEQAIDWFATHTDQLTALEMDFLETSYRWETGEQEKERRRTTLLRRFAIGFGVALGITLSMFFIAVILGLLAWQNAQEASRQRSAALSSEAEANQQRQAAYNQADARATAESVAIEEKNKALTQSRIAIAGQLSSQAKSQFTNNPDLGLLLNVEAIRARESITEASTLIDNLDHQIWSDLLFELAANRSFRGNLSSFAVLSDITFGPDGKTLRSIGYDGILTTWDLTSHQPVTQVLLGTMKYGQTYTFTPDRSQIMTLGCKEYGAQGNSAPKCDTFAISLWRISSLAQISDIEVDPTMLSMASYPLLWAPDGKKFVTGGCATMSPANCTLGLVRVWYISGTVPISQTWYDHHDRVGALALDSRGTMLASGGWDGSIILWDLTRGEKSTTLVGQSTPAITSLSFSPNGKYLAAGANDGSVAVWDVSSASLVNRMPGYMGGVDIIAFSPDSQLVATGSDRGITLWSVVTGSLKNVLTGHNGSLRHLVFSSDGTQLASLGIDNKVFVWDVMARESLAFSLGGHLHGGQSAAFSPNQNQIASVGRDGSVALWTITNGEFVSQTLLGHASWAYDIVFAAHGKSLFSSGSDGVIQFNALTGARANHGLEIAQNVFRIAASPDGNLLAGSGCARYENGKCVQGQIVFWDTDSGKLVGQPLHGHTDLVSSIAFSVDGKLLVSGSRDGTILFWDVMSRKPLSPPLARGGPVTQIALSPHNQLLASVVMTQGIQLRSLQANYPVVQELTSTTSVNAIAFNNDGTKLASAEDTALVVWDLAHNQPISATLAEDIGSFTNVTFSPNGKLLLTTGDQGISFWEADTDQLIQAFPAHHSAVYSLAFSADGRTLVTGGDDNALDTWNVGTGQMQSAPLLANRDNVMSIATEVTGNLLATGSCDTNDYGVSKICTRGGIRVWRTQDWTNFDLVASLVGHRSFVTQLAFHPNGHFLASGGYDGTLLIWGIEKSVSIGSPVIAHNGPIRYLRYFSGGTKLLSAGDDGLVKIWVNATGTLTTTNSFFVPSITAAALARDETQLAVATSDGQLSLWDVQTGRPVGVTVRLTEKSTIRSIAWSPDSKLLAVGYDDGTIILWDLQIGQRLGDDLRGGTRTIWQLAFSPDGTRLASVSDDGTVLLWDMEHTAWQQRACLMANRNLTLREWKQYAWLLQEGYRATCPQVPLASDDLLQLAESYAQAGNSTVAEQTFGEAARQAQARPNAATHDSICRAGATYGFARAVLASCDIAVQIDPENGRYRDSRGIARASLEDLNGAVEDFEFFVKWAEAMKIYAQDVAQRKDWIEKLKSGQNPIDATTLETLR